MYIFSNFFILMTTKLTTKYDWWISFHARDFSSPGLFWSKFPGLKGRLALLLLVSLVDNTAVSARHHGHGWSRVTTLPHARQSCPMVAQAVAHPQPRPWYRGGWPRCTLPQKSSWSIAKQIWVNVLQNTRQKVKILRKNYQNSDIVKKKTSEV